MVLRPACVGLALAATVLVGGCCHKWCRQPAAVVTSSPVICPTAAPCCPDAGVVTPAPLQTYSVPTPGCNGCRH
jgi:hypothetical protein